MNDYIILQLPPPAVKLQVNPGVGVLVDHRLISGDIGLPAAGIPAPEAIDPMAGLSPGGQGDAPLQTHRPEAHHRRRLGLG